jgi:hypothetical protein
MTKKTSQGSKLRRTREHLYMLAATYAPRCYVCGEEIDADAIVQGNASDGLTWHHIDFDRTNNAPYNMALCHRGCHRSFHNSYEKGDDIRTRDAKTHWGPTPLDQAPNRARVGGSILAGNVNIQTAR